MLDRCASDTTARVCCHPALLNGWNCAEHADGRKPCISWTASHRLAAQTPLAMWERIKSGNTEDLKQGAQKGARWGRALRWQP